MSKQFKVGVIGTGMFGCHHIESFQRHPEAEVVHIANRGEAARNTAATKYGIKKTSADAMELINDPEVGAVIVCTPPFSHAEYGIAALEAGKHLLLEKPMAVTVEQGRRLVECAAAHPQQVVLEASCRHTRLHAKFRFIKNFIDSGKIGTVYHIQQQALSRNGFFEYNPNGAAWCLDKTMAGGGQTLDMGEYDLGFHLGLLDDKPEILDFRSMSVNGLRDYPGYNVTIEQHASAWMQFTGGLSYYYERGGPVHMDAPEETKIYGSKGGMRFAWQTWMPWSFEWYHDGADGKPVTETIDIPRPDGQHDDDEVAAHFMDCLADRAKPLMPLNLAFRYFSLSMQIASGTRTL